MTESIIINIFLKHSIEFIGKINFLFISINIIMKQK